MQDCSDLPEPPSADEPTDAELARYIVARCRELERLADHLDGPEIARLLREARARTQEFLDTDDRSDS